MNKLKSRGKTDPQRERLGFTGGLREIRSNKLLYCMMIPAVAWIILFSYVPLYGILIAFKRLNYRLGIWGSPWVGLENFRFLFNYYGIGRVFFNTIFLNVLFIAAGTFFSVFLALVFVEAKNGVYKKVVQTIAIFPHFVSWPVVAMFLGGIIGSSGIFVKILTAFGGSNPDFFSNARYWPAIFVFLKIWKGAGFGTIVYVAVITGFDPEMYEAAKIDGASKIQQITRITLPLLRVTVVMLTILAVGGIFTGDFGMIYTVVGDNPALFSTTDVVDTFVYRALRTLNNIGMTTATGVFQSIVGFILVMVTNRLVKLVEPDAAIF